MKTNETITEIEKTAALASDSFTIEGRTYTMHKRQPGPGAPWHINARVGGKRIHVSAQTNIASNAKQIFTKIIKAARSGHWDALTETGVKRSTTPTVATIHDVLECYDAHHRDGISDKSRKTNINVIKSMCRLVLGADVDLAATPISALDGSFVRRWKEKILVDCEDEDEMRSLQIRRSANSLFRMARCLFARHVLPIYSDYKLVIPGATRRAFCEEPDFRRVGKQEYMPPNDELLNKTLAALEPLKSTDRNLYLAVYLALAAGLRRSEIADARWSWFICRDGRPFLSCREQIFKGKLIDIPLMQPWGQRLLDLRPAAATDESTVLDGTVTERLESVARRASAWLHGQGWTTQKALHEFRAWAGCQVAMRDGIYAASLFLRHSSINVTEKHYMRYVKMASITNNSASTAPAASPSTSLNK